MHPRAGIRAAVRAALVAADTAAGARVFGMRPSPLRRLELPALAVYFEEESVTESSRHNAPRDVERDGRLVVEGIVEANEETEDALDALALEVETALGQDPTFGGRCSDSLLQRTTLDVTDAGDKLLGVVRLEYVASYEMRVQAEVADDFSTAQVTYNPNETVHPDDRAVDLIEVPT